MSDADEFTGKFDDSGRSPHIEDIEEDSSDSVLEPDVDLAIHNLVQHQLGLFRSKAAKSGIDLDERWGAGKNVTREDMLWAAMVLENINSIEVEVRIDLSDDTLLKCNQQLNTMREDARYALQLIFDQIQLTSTGDNLAILIDKGINELKDKMPDDDHYFLLDRKIKVSAGRETKKDVKLRDVLRGVLVKRVSDSDVGIRVSPEIALQSYDELCEYIHQTMMAGERHKYLADASGEE